MNITDIDDKIIKRARQNHLYETYLSENHNLEKVLSDCNAVMVHFRAVVEQTTDPDKRAMHERLFNNLKEAVNKVAEAVKTQAWYIFICSHFIPYLKAFYAEVDKALKTQTRHTVRSYLVFDFKSSVGKCSYVYYGP